MTYYFDKFGAELGETSKLRNDPTALAQRLTELEHRLVRDVSIAAEWDGFPADLRESIHRLILRHGVMAEGCDNERAAESVEEHVREISYLAGYLHDVFHALAERHLDGFSDDPTVPLRNLVDEASEYRVSLRQK